jgi:AraC family transcriptional regulator
MAYAERVNLAIDHVVGHLGEPLRLADVARAARLSPFHFHRVFQVLVGEALAGFVKRFRLERALVMMAGRVIVPLYRSSYRNEIRVGCGSAVAS